MRVRVRNGWIDGKRLSSRGKPKQTAHPPQNPRPRDGAMRASQPFLTVTSRHHNPTRSNHPPPLFSTFQSRNVTNRLVSQLKANTGTLGLCAYVCNVIVLLGVGQYWAPVSNSQRSIAFTVHRCTTWPREPSHECFMPGMRVPEVREGQRRQSSDNLLRLMSVHMPTNARIMSAELRVMSTIAVSMRIALPRGGVSSSRAPQSGPLS